MILYVIDVSSLQQSITIQLIATYYGWFFRFAMARQLVSELFLKNSKRTPSINLNAWRPSLKVQKHSYKKTEVQLAHRSS